MFAQEGEHHIEVDERFGALGQLLHQDVELLALFGEGLRQVLDAFGVGADTLADAEQVGSGNLHVASFGARIAVPSHSIQRVDLEEMTEDSFVNQRLALAHLEAHRVDKHAVVHRARGIAREEEVIQRLQQVALVVLAVPLGVLVAFDEHRRQLIGRQVHQLLTQVVVAVVHVAALLHQVFPDFFIFQQFLQDILHVVHLGPLLQHTAEVVVFSVDDRLVQDIAIEGVGGVERGHAFNLHTRAVQQHGTQTARFRGHVDIAGFYSIIVHIIINHYHTATSPHRGMSR